MSRPRALRAGGRDPAALDGQLIDHGRSGALWDHLPGTAGGTAGGCQVWRQRGAGAPQGSLTPTSSFHRWRNRSAPPPSSEIPPRQAPPCPPWSPLSERLSSWPKRQPFLSAPGENNGLERKLPVRELVVWPTQCQMLMRWRFCRLFRPLNEQCVPLGVYHSALPPRSRWHLLSSSEESS